MCSKLHCQIVFKLKLFSYKIRDERACLSSADAQPPDASPSTETQELQ